MTYRIDNLQYCNWSEEIFKINNEAGLNAIHVTIAYHEDFDEVKNNVERWNTYFEEFDNLLGNIDERRLPWPGGIKQGYEKVETKEI